MPDELRVAILGCGRIAWAHALGWVNDRRVRVVAVADPDPRARDRLGQALLVPPERRFTDYRDLLGATGIDIASVCLWTGEHRRAVEMAVKVGARAVLCEKPLAPNLADAALLHDLARESRVLLAVGHQRRFYSSWDRLRDMIVAGELGTPLYARASVSGGLLNNGTHVVDMLRYLLPAHALTQVFGAVQRDTDRYERGIRTEDLALAWFGFSGGFNAVLECDLSPNAKVGAGATIQFSDGLAEIRESNVDVRTGGAGWRRLPESMPHVPESVFLTEVVEYLSPVLPAPTLLPFATAFATQASAVVDALGAPDATAYRSDAESAYAATEAVMAVYESVRRRSVVSLPIPAHDRHVLDLLVDEGGLPTPATPPYDTRSATRPIGGAA